MAAPPGGQWRYTVNIPLWITGKDAEGESVVVSSAPRLRARSSPKCAR